MIRRLVMQLGLASTFSLLSISAFGAIVNGVFPINAASFNNWYIEALEGPCTPSAPGSFFSCTLGSMTGTAVSIVNVSSNPGSGTLDVDYEDTTGEIDQVNSMVMLLPDMDITIISGSLSGFITVRAGIAGPGTGGADIAKILSGTAGFNGTVDPDKDVLFATGSSITKFQHEDLPNLDVPESSAFSDIIDTCTGSVCTLFSSLSFDGIRYEIDGTVSAGGLNSFNLTAEWLGSINSYGVGFTTGAAVPVPAAVWLFGSALGLLGWMRRKST